MLSVVAAALIAAGAHSPVYLDCERGAFHERFAFDEGDAAANLTIDGKVYTGRAVYSPTSVSLWLGGGDEIYTIDRRTLAYTQTVTAINYVSHGTCALSKPDGLKF